MNTFFKSINKTTQCIQPQINKASLNEHVSLDRPVVDGDVLNKRVSLDRPVIYGDVLNERVSLDRPVVDGDVTLDRPVIYGDVTLDRPVIYGDFTLDRPVVDGDVPLDGELVLDVAPSLGDVGPAVDGHVAEATLGPLAQVAGLQVLEYGRRQRLDQVRVVRVARPVETQAELLVHRGRFSLTCRTKTLVTFFKIVIYL